VTELLINAVAFTGLLYLATKMVLAIMVYWTAAHYDEVVTKDDAVVRAQVDAYSAQQERIRRSYLSDLAEKAQGNPQNTRGEERLTEEKMGHAVGTFAADAIAKETEARRRFKLGLFAAATSLVSKP
jgi:hypothetical protein